MCNCKNVKLQTYTNQVVIINPFTNKSIGIDKCIVDELLELWVNGIETTGCCCGHNTIKPVINVVKNHHNKMVNLRYKFWINEFGIYCYEPKSV